MRQERSQFEFKLFGSAAPTQIVKQAACEVHTEKEAAPHGAPNAQLVPFDGLFVAVHGVSPRCSTESPPAPLGSAARRKIRVRLALERHGGAGHSKPAGLHVGVDGHQKRPSGDLTNHHPFVEVIQQPQDTPGA